MKSRALNVLVVVLALLAAVQALRIAGATAGWILDQWSDPRVLVEMKSDRTGVAQLYWNAGRPYNEDDSATSLVQGGDRWQRLVFPVPDDPIRSARLDPLRSEGTVEIRTIQLQTASGAGLMALPLDAIQAGAQVQTREDLGDRVRLIFKTGANDPILNLGPLVADKHRGPADLPWVGALCLVLLSGALFALRSHSVGIRQVATMLRTSLPTWAGRLDPIDRPAWPTLLIGGVLVGLVQLWFLIPLHLSIDLPLWDEALSMGGGVAFLQGKGLGHVVNSPFSKLVYAGLVFVFGPSGAIFAGHYLVKTALAVVLFLLMARLAGSVLVGLVVAVLWTISGFQLQYPILVYQGGLVCFGLGLFAIGRNLPLGLVLVILATLTRLEYEFVVVLLAVGSALAVFSGRWNPKQVSRVGWVMSALGMGLLVMVGLNLSGWNSGIDRGWIAVKQHYGLRLWASGEFPGVNPFLEYNLVTDRDFPGAESLGAAVRENPSALFGHVGWNLRRLPAAFAELFRPVNAGPFPDRLPLLVTLLLVAAGLVEVFRAPGRCADRFRTWVRCRPLLAAGLLGGVLVVAPGIIVYAKAPYLLPVVPLALALVAALHRLGAVRRVASRIGVLLALLLMLVHVSTTPRPFTDTTRPRTVLETVEVLESVLPEEGKVVLLGVAASSYLPYLGTDRLSGFDPLWPASAEAVDAQNAKMDRMIGLYNPDLIMIDSRWSQSTYFDSEGAAKLSGLGWSATPLPDGMLWIRPSFPSGHVREKAE